MLRLSTAGESHGEALVALVSGLPAGVPIDQSYIDRELWRRQQGYGRGGRMKIEHDSAHFLSGVRHGRTIASEYASKAYLVLDSLRQHRSDAALIRIITPVTAGNAVATRMATDFVQSLSPLLGAHIPD